MLVMRVQGSLRVVLNTMIWPDMLVERSSKRSVRMSAVDADDGIKIYLIQVYHLSLCMNSTSNCINSHGTPTTVVVGIVVILLKNA